MSLNLVKYDLGKKPLLRTASNDASPLNHEMTLTLQRLYTIYVGQVRRIDAMRRSPIFAHFDQSVTGATSIRAYNKLEAFTGKCDRLIDDSQKPYYMVIVAQRWLGTFIDQA